MNDEVEEREHPHDRIFKREVNKAIRSSSVQMAKLNFGEFKKIEFEPYFPGVILDFIEYCTGLKMIDISKAETERKHIAHKDKIYREKFREARLKDPLLKEEVF